MTSREQMARIAEPVAGNTLKSSGKSVFMSGKECEWQSLAFWTWEEAVRGKWRTMCDSPCLVIGLLPKTGVFPAATAVSVRLLAQTSPVTNTSSGTSLDFQTPELACTLKLIHSLHIVCKGGFFCASLITVVRTTILRKCACAHASLCPP